MCKSHLSHLCTAQRGDGATLVVVTHPHHPPRLSGAAPAEFYWHGAKGRVGEVGERWKGGEDVQREGGLWVEQSGEGVAVQI